MTTNYAARREVLTTLLPVLDRMSQELIDRQMDDDDHTTVRKLWELFQELNTKPGSARLYTVLEGREHTVPIDAVKRRMMFAGHVYGPQPGPSS